MSQKRAGEESGVYEGRNGVPTLAEAARMAAGKADEKGGDERVSLFWRVFGGTILSMVTLGAITLYNSISSNISELRAELSRERDARTELVRKDEFNTRTSNQYERIRSLDGLRGDYEGLKERVGANAATVEAIRKDTTAAADAAKKDAAALAVLTERVATLEALRKEVAGLDSLKEKVVTAAADLKLVRDDVLKITQEQDRNRAADLERKSSRDSQYKAIDETLKELQKGLQACREKIARLEGGMPPAAKSNDEK